MVAIEKETHTRVHSSHRHSHVPSTQGSEVWDGECLGEGSPRDEGQVRSLGNDVAIYDSIVFCRLHLSLPSDLRRCGDAERT